jgi:DNA-binding CsgD family transcriptional regulator/tetratricopeptide (TPR) repeat protein
MLYGTMELLERESQIETLRAILQDVSSAGDGVGGRVLLVGGEAGIGKTALVENFTRQYCRPNQVLFGACDALFTPRPLGPLHDIARQSYPRILELLNAGTGWLPVASAFLEALQKADSTVVVVIEDVHWADEATFDLLKFMGRRIQQARALLILTYRDDEVGAQHPLRFLLGDLPPRLTTRLALPPLSEGAVGTLARRSGIAATADASSIYWATGGNPFFVTEVLASEQAGVPGLPDTVRDAVLGRALRLSAAARRVLDLASIVPGSIEPWLVKAVLPQDAPSTGECVELGLLRASDPEGAGTALAFRHELARRAIESALSPTYAKELHVQALRACLEVSGGDESTGKLVSLARLVHHAAHAGDTAVLRFAPQAGRQASKAGAHREAAAHFATALRYAQSAHTNMLSDEERASLLESCSFEYYLTGAIDDAIAAREEATRLRRQAGQQERAGDDVRWLSRLYWWNNHRKEAEQAADEAIAMLEPLEPGEALAMAYSNRSQLYMLADKPEEARRWARSALQLAERLGATEILVHALINMGTSEIKAGGFSEKTTLERGLALARQHEMHDHAGRAYANLISLAVQMREYKLAEQYLNEGLAYTTARDIDSYSIYLRGWLARLHFEQGRWKEAEEAAGETLRAHGGGSVIPIPALIVLGHLKVRQGGQAQNEGRALLDEARKLAMPTGELQRIGPLAVARAEATWWDGDLARCVEEARVGYEMALGGTDSWILGMLSYWLWRAGGLAALPDAVPGPFKEMVGGHWLEAAQSWERIGCPYEQALSLAEGDEEARLQALRIFERLGARPAMNDLKRRLRAERVKGVPRGPRPPTRANRFGLTARESEVLALVEEGLSNAEIGTRMSISPKTVDHHVSSILGKLNAHKRSEAAAIMRRVDGND